MIKILDKSDRILDNEQPAYSPEFSVAFFDQRSLVYEHLCLSIQNILSSGTCDQWNSCYGSQALMKNHGFLHKTKRQQKIKAKNVLSSRKNEVFVVLDVEESGYRGGSSSAGLRLMKIFNAVGIKRIKRIKRKK